MSSKRSFALALLGLVLVAACSSPRVIANCDPSADFSAYRTYGFPPRLGTDEASYGSILSQVLKSAAERELAARGYEPSDDPDLLVNFFLDTEEKTRTVETPGVAYGYGMYTGYDTTVVNYTEGTLHIDLVDRERKQLVWEGIVIGRVTDDVRKKLQEKVDKAVAEVFAEYPFVAGGHVAGGSAPGR